MKKIVIDYIIVTICTLIIAASFNAFFFSFQMIISGSSGLSILLNHLFQFNPAIVVLIIHIIALIFGYKLLGFKRVSKSIYGSLLYPFFIEITSFLKDYMKDLPTTSSDFLVLIIFGAVISGYAAGIIYKRGYTTGGSDIFAQIINKYVGKTIGISNFIFNSFIIMIGGFVLGFTKVIYAVLILYINGLITDFVLLGNYSNKIFYIITNENDKVKEHIWQQFNIHVTELESIGGYTSDKSNVLLCLLPNYYYYKLREEILKIDKTAFFLIAHAYEFEK